MWSWAFKVCFLPSDSLFPWRGRRGLCGGLVDGTDEIEMAQKGIVGRGVLLDFHSWRLRQSPPVPYEAFEAGSIPLKYLLATAEAQGTEIKFGDVLFIRSGG